jgi:hypothetical protein
LDGLTDSAAFLESVRDVSEMCQVDVTPSGANNSTRTSIQFFFLQGGSRDMTLSEIYYLAYLLQNVDLGTESERERSCYLRSLLGKLDRTVRPCNRCRSGQLSLED